MSGPHLWIARALRPFRWRDPRRTARMLLAFAEVERSSFHDLMAAANGTPDLARRAAYLRHAADEARHGRAFAERAAALDPDAVPRGVDFEHLYERLGEPAFLAFVYLGERRGRAQMAMYVEELRALVGTPRADPETLALFEAITADEAQHEAYTGVLAERLGGSLVSASLWELGRSWRRLAATTSTALFTATMAVVYLALAPLALLARRR